MVYFPAADGALARYEPDSPKISYAPPSVPGNPFQRLQIYLPDPVRFPRPPKGYRTVAATPFGGFASAQLPPNVQDLQAGTPGAYWKILEEGMALAILGVTGSDTARYAPGGELYGQPGQPTLPAQVKGNGTFDLPGLTTAGFDHHPLPGSSLDGGQSQPRDDHPVPVKDLAWGVQKLRQIGHIYGLDTRRIFGFGRSAGSLVVGALACGPDYKDPAMADHRRFSSRLDGAVVWASTCWIPAWNQSAASSPACPYLPRNTNPEAIALSLLDAPPIYPREASYVRIGTKSPELRAALANKPFVIVNLDTESNLGLTSLTPSQAVLFNGTDASNIRLPAMQNEISAGISHPGIQGVLFRVRLRELGPTFHAANTTLILRDAGLQALTSHVTEDGFPLPSLVTTTQEQLEAARGYEPGWTIAEKIKAQFDRWATEDAAAQPPATPPVIYARKKVRQAAVARLLGKIPAIGSKVFSTRIRPLDAKDLPAICVYLESEQAEVVSEVPRVYRLRGELRFEIYDRAGVVLDDRLDDIATAVQALVDTEPTLGDTVLRLEYQRTEALWEADGTKPAGALRVTYEAEYVHAVEAPGDLYDLQKVGVGTDLDSDGQAELSQDLYPEQLLPNAP